jgi:poly(A) polymerase
MLDESGLLREILPETDWDEHIDRSLRLMKKGVPEDFATAVLLHETPADRILGILERLKFSRNEMHHILALRESLPRFDGIQQMSTSQLKRFFRRPRFEEHLELARIHALAGNGDVSGYEYARQKYLSWPQSVIAPPPLISGQDLIEMGFRPGPIFTQILTRVEDEQLEERLDSRQQALDFVRLHYRSEGQR